MDLDDGSTVDQPGDLVLCLCAPIADAAHEIARVAYLDGNGQLLGIAEHHGSRDRIALSIRTLAREALERDARALVLAHNHPSGDATPSADDLSFTRQLTTTMHGIGVRLLDHLIVTEREGVSLRRAGLL